MQIERRRDKNRRPRETFAFDGANCTRACVYKANTFRTRECSNAYRTKRNRTKTIEIPCLRSELIYEMPSRVSPGTCTRIAYCVRRATVAARGPTHAHQRRPSDRSPRRGTRAKPFPGALTSREMPASQLIPRAHLHASWCAASPRRFPALYVPLRRGRRRRDGRRIPRAPSLLIHIHVCVCARVRVRIYEARPESKFRFRFLSRRRCRRDWRLLGDYFVVCAARW